MNLEFNDMTKAYWERQEGKKIVLGPSRHRLSNVFMFTNLALAQAELVQKILTWIQSGLRRSNPPSMQEEGTCEWIFAHPAYTTWAVKNYSRPLWINGIPGL